MVDSLSPRFSYKGIRFVSGKGGRIVGGGKSSFPQLSLGISTFFPLFASTSVPLIPFLKTVPRRLTATVSRFRPPGQGAGKKIFDFDRKYDIARTANPAEEGREVTFN